MLLIKSTKKNPSSEHRVFYVAVTRAKKSLHILEPTTQRYYEI
jgi:superfamily I DNA/RNA helicase